MTSAYVDPVNHDDSIDPFVQDAITRMKQLHERAGSPVTHQRGLLPETFEELQISLEELEVASEELRLQNEELIRKRHQIEVEQNRYQELFNFAPDAYMVTDQHGIVFEANRAAASLFGINQQFIRGKPLANLIVDGDRGRFRDYLTRLQKSNDGSAPFVVEIRPRQGVAFPAEITTGLMKSVLGEVTGIRWLIRDITAQRQAEAQRLELIKAQAAHASVEQTFRLLSEVVEDIADPLFAVEADWSLRYINRQGEKEIERDRSTVLKKSLWEAIPAFVGSYFGEQLQIAMAENRLVQFETMNPLSGCWVSVDAHPIEFGIVVVYRDIDDQKRELDRITSQLQHDQHVAEVLQAALMLQPGQTDIPGVEIASAYQAAMREAMVGGDFCDVVPLQNGQVALLVGDVTGKGLDAARLTAQLKYALRVFLWEDSEPATVLSRINRFYLSQSPVVDNKLIALAIAVIDPLTGSVEISSAGSEPVIISRADGIEVLGPGGMIIGADESSTYRQYSYLLDIGDSVIMVTDGITEARDGKSFFGMAGLSEVISSLSTETTVESQCDAITVAAQTFAKGTLHDDTCILICRKASQT